ncbi:MAG: glutaredoxin 3 [Gammaproteobacteria bacterium]
MAKVVIYTKQNCAYCDYAKQLLDNKKVAYQEIRVDLDPTKLTEMVTLSNRRTTPQIFINDTPIGGFDDLAALETAGKLKDLLK